MCESLSTALYKLIAVETNDTVDATPVTKGISHDRRAVTWFKVCLTVYCQV